MLVFWVEDKQTYVITLCAPSTMHC